MGNDVHKKKDIKIQMVFDEYKIESVEEAINCNELWNLNNGRTLCNDCHKEVTFK